ncbi:hypothetical protein AVEN_164555-1 [Araneus ventricosus]|uniref:Uncharacterized protein n=1 Tax=Araneus ventricosus TaxID=182803 RepID=A0A4Y2B4Z8_ARAVE|nr:hypothetical protein AVEN_164555-1 [Araneus ventricosus]
MGISHPLDPIFFFINSFFLLLLRSTGKVSALGRKFPGSKPNSTENPPCMWACCMLNHKQRTTRPPAGVVRNLGQGVPAQASSSSYESVLKLQDPSQNIPCIASKRDINTTELK